MTEPDIEVGGEDEGDPGDPTMSANTKKDNVDQLSTFLNRVNIIHKYFENNLPAEFLGKRFCPGENKVGGECLVLECMGG